MPTESRRRRPLAAVIATVALAAASVFAAAPAQALPPAPVWVTSELGELRVGQPLAVPLQATGATHFSLVNSSFPVDVLPFGFLMGAPGEAGPYSISIRATDVLNPDTAAVMTFTGEVLPELPRFDPQQTLPHGTVGLPYSARINASATTRLTIGGALPAGITVSAATGDIRGTPAEAGTFVFDATAVNDATGESATRRFEFVVDSGASPSLMNGAGFPELTVGEPMSYTFTADRPAVFGITGAPAGLVADGATLSGTPTQAGTSPFWVHAANEVGMTTTTVFAAVRPAEPATPAPPQNTVPASAVTAGGPISVTGTGFVPGEPVEVWLHSTPVRLGTLIAGADGAVSGTVTIPADTEGGIHHLVLVDGTGNAYPSGDLAVTARPVVVPEPETPAEEPKPTPGLPGPPEAPGPPGAPGTSAETPASAGPPAAAPSHPVAAVRATPAGSAGDATLPALGANTDPATAAALFALLLGGAMAAIARRRTRGPARKRDASARC